LLACDFARLPVLTAEQYEILHTCASFFDRRLAEEPPRPKRVVMRVQDSELSPGDEYDLYGPPWREILEPHGWTLVQDKGEVQFWRLPDKDKGISATTGFCRGQRGEPLLKVFSTSTYPLETKTPYGRFRAMATLRYGGDLSAAAKDLVAERGGGTGQRQRSPQSGDTQAQPDEPPVALVRCLADIWPEPVNWLWKSWVARGCLNLLEGDPDLGKSTITLDLAARVARGWPMPPLPGGTQEREPADVLLLRAEDSASQYHPAAPGCRRRRRGTRPPIRGGQSAGRQTAPYLALRPRPCGGNHQGQEHRAGRRGLLAGLSRCPDQRAP
jgi:hypothetical protein